MAHKIKIKFRNSSSVYYESAILNAKEFEKFNQSESKRDYNILEISSDELQIKITFFNALWEAVKSWKGTEIYLDDRLLDPNSMNQINEVSKCYVNYTKTVVQEKHCMINCEKEGWSCKLLDSIGRYLNGEFDNYYHQRNKWFEFGKFVSPLIWEIDKRPIAQM